MKLTELRTESRSNPLPTSRFVGRRVHFIGIGGCGMAGLAKMLMDAGAKVTGSEPNFNEQTLALIQRGAKITRDQLGELLDKDLFLVVRTAAVPDHNIEFIAARRLGLTVIKYAQLLGLVMRERIAIAVAGTHGKTTTTSMISHALLACGADPSFVIGGTVPQLGGSSRSGKGQSFVVEACEYDRSFHNLHPAVALITNIETDHLDCYKDLADIIASFRHFVSLVPADGLILANGQDPHVATALGGLDRPIQWIGLTNDNNIAPVSTLDWNTIELPAREGCHRGNVHFNGQPVAELHLAIPGAHNLFNATLALAACNAAGIAPGQAAAAINTFTGVDRRMSHVGEFNGAILVDDYGHHPTEIRATLSALRQRYSPQRLLCVFQPHQHSRTRTLMDDFATCFANADIAIIADIYASRDSEEEKRLTTSRHLVDRINAAGNRALHIPTFPEITEYLKSQARPGDLILTIGAGNVCDIGRELLVPSPVLGRGLG